MNHPGRFVQWSGDPYLEGICGHLLREGGRSHSFLVPLSGRRRQTHLDGLHRSLGAVRDPQLGENALQVPLYRRETYMQLLGDLAVGLTQGEAAEDFHLPGRQRVGQ